MSITLIIVLISIVASVLALNDRGLFYKLDLNPYAIAHRNEAHRFVTHAFIHADWGHLIINMYVLYQFGKLVEDGFQLYFGQKWILYFLMLYVGGILFSSLPGFAKYKDVPVYHAVGASGAVSAVVFSFILMAPMADLGIIFIPIRIPAFVFGGLYLAAEIYLERRQVQGDRIAHSAHYAGAIFGLVLTFILEPQLLLHYFQ